MVKAVVGEEARLPLVEDRLAQSSLPAEALTDFHTLLFIDEIVNLRILISVSLFVRFFFSGWSCNRQAQFRFGSRICV